VHTARDEHPGSLERLAGTQRKQAIVVGRVVELSVLLHVEARGEPLDARYDVVVVAPQFSLP
jgi:hypothetical protein